MSLTQSGVVLSGSGTLKGIECLESFSFDGFLDTNGPTVTIQGELQSDASILTAIGSVDNEGISLLISGTAAPCGSASGRFELTRR